ncbi:MAG: MFS transporter [Nocardioidaceae bacterium]
MRLPHALAPLRERQFAWFYATRVVNTTGSMMVSVALAFAVLDLGHSATALGQVLAARTIPMVAFLLFGGVLADRFPRSAILQLSNLLSAATQGTVAWLVITGTADLWMLVVLEAVNGTVAAFSFPALEGMTPQLVPRAHLQQANALVSFSRGGLAVIGPSLAGLLVVTVGPGWALAADAATYLVATVLIRQVRVPPRAPGGERDSVLRQLRDGWTLFTGRTWLWVVVSAFALLNAVHSGAWFTLGPALAKETFGAKGWGYILSAESFGLVAMTLVLVKVRIRRPLLSGMLGITAFSVPLLVLGLQPHVGLLVVAAFASGAGSELFGIGWNVAMQENVEEHLLSRAYSYDAVGSFVAMPVGQIVYGPLGEAFGYQRVLVLSGVLYAGVCLLTLSSRSVRALGRAPVEAAAT